MRIGFWLTTPKQFDPAKLDETPFGGAEISAINLAKELAKNNDVFIFGNVCGNLPFVHYNRLFTHYDDLHVRIIMGLDILICVRADQNLLNPRRNHLLFGEHKPKKIILWTGDAYDQPNNDTVFNDIYSLREIDLIVTKSRWQNETLIEHFPLLRKSKMGVMRSGVDADSIPEASMTKEPRFIYASTAYRGLHRFLEIWPEIKKRIPNATLDCYCKTTLYIDDNPRDADFTELYNKIEAMDGVTIKEPLPQKKFLKELSKYNLMLYPNSGFVESSCGVVLQSMACGVPVISTQKAGLIETLGMGRGHGVDEGDNYVRDFVNRVDIVYNEKGIDNSYWIKQGRDNILNKYSWRKIAKRWEQLLNQTANNYQESSLESLLAVV